MNPYHYPLDYWLTRFIFDKILPKHKSPRSSTIYTLKKLGTKPLNVIEIGVYKGLNTLVLFKFLNIHHIYLIDPYNEFFQNELYIRQDELNKARNTMLHNLRKFKDKYSFLECFSEQAVFTLSSLNLKFDYIYIDGDHSKHAVFDDISNFLPLLKPNGILAGHDIDNVEVLEGFINFKQKNPNFKYQIMGSDFVIEKKNE